MNRTNRLGREKSPYLLQHKDNPVAWFPWGDEAFAAARAEDRPIFLSVGYATCHWCHVMERESFEDPEVSELLNRHFISIKVDREELPDVDQIYMNAVHAMGMRGGWPMSIVMTPDLKPFFGGTYFPKANFMHILEQLAKAWREDRPKIREVAEELFGHLEASSRLSSGQARLDEELLRKAFEHDLETFDQTYGGFGSAPKFPPSMQLRLLLRIHHRTGDERALEMVETTLDRMARGGMYDHLGGGFARYSTDERWLVPHFEKMLYDNALLAVAYLEAYQVARNPMFAAVARETLDYVLRDMTSPEGGFYSAEDADSEGIEGKFYVWTEAELERHLTKEEFERFVFVYGVSEQGNFEHGTNILHLRRGMPWSVKEEPLISSAHRTLFAVREQRVHPLKDDKQLTSWNGLMIGAMAKGWQVLRDVRYLEAAQRSARFIREKLYRDGRLLRRYRDGEAAFEGTLDDYAYLVQGLITLYESDFDAGWIHWALELQRAQDALFWDEAQGAYFFTPADAPALIVRNKELIDGATPSSNGCSALSLLELHHLTYDEALREKAERLLQAGGKVLEQYPWAFATTLIALDFQLSGPREVAVVGRAGAPESEAVLEALHRPFSPARVVAFGPPGGAAPLPVLEHRVMMGGKPTLYVCEQGACRMPTTDLEEALRLLQDRRMYNLSYEVRR